MTANHIEDIVFRRVDPELGEFTLRPIDPADDNDLLHSWVTHPKSEFWLMRAATPADVLRESRRIAADPLHDAFLGLCDGIPSFLVERYDPYTELGHLYGHLPGDVGMHCLAAPTGWPRPGFTRAVLTTVMELLFGDPTVHRVVVEPDVRNTRVHALNAAVGFRVVGTVCLPHKNAYLSVCTREDYLESRGAK